MSARCEPPTPRSDAMRSSRQHCYPSPCGGLRFIVACRASQPTNFARETQVRHTGDRHNSRIPCTRSTTQQFVSSNKLSKACQQMHNILLGKVFFSKKNPTSRTAPACFCTRGKSWGYELSTTLFVVLCAQHQYFVDSAALFAGAPRVLATKILERCPVQRFDSLKTLGGSRQHAQDT